MLNSIKGYTQSLQVHAYQHETSKPPTREYIIETRDLLRDFQIWVKIPKFKTLGDLLRWRTQQIKRRMGVL